MRIGAVAWAAPKTWVVWVGTMYAAATPGSAIVGALIAYSGSVSLRLVRGSANTSSLPGPSLRTVSVAVTGLPASTLSPLGTPLAFTLAASKEMRPVNGAESVVPPTGVMTLTTNFQRPG